jgi:hypothetical protein
LIVIPSDRAYEQIQSDGRQGESEATITKARRILGEHRFMETSEECVSRKKKSDMSLASKTLNKMKTEN